MLIRLENTMLVRRRVVPTTSATPVAEGIFVSRIEDLARVVTGIDVDGMDGSDLVFGFGQGGVSRVKFRSHPGSAWTATGDVSLDSSGDLLPCKFGPIFMDEAGKIIKWWQSPPVSFVDDKPMHLSIDAIAPEGAYWVRLGMIGPWTQDGKTTATYRYANCRLVQSAPVASQQE